MRLIVGWLVFVAFLVGLGALIHAGAGPTPRWRVRLPADQERPLRRVALINDNTRLLTMSGIGKDGSDCGPIVVRDTATGQVIASLLSEDDRFDSFAVSPSGRFAVGVVSLDENTREYRTLDLRTGEQRRFPLVPSDDLMPPYFSPREDLVVFIEQPTGTRFIVFERATGKQVASLPRNPGTKPEWRGDWLLSRSGGKGKRKQLHAWHVRQRRPLDIGEVVEMNADGRYQLRQAHTGRLNLWRLDNPEEPVVVGELPHSPRASVQFTPTGGRIVIADRDAPTPTVEVWSTDPLRRRWRMTPASPVSGISVAPDGRFALVTESGGAGLRRQYLLDLEKETVARELTPAENADLLCDFSPDSRAVLRHREQQFVEALDCETGKVRPLAVVPFPLWGPFHFAADGRQLWLHGRQLGSVVRLWDLEDDGWVARFLRWLRPKPPDELAGVLLCLDWPSGRPLLRLPDMGIHDYHVAKDGSFVVTVHTETETGRIIARWDVPQPKPWAWIVGTPLAVGAALVGTHWAWSRRRRKEEQPTPA